MPAHSRAAIRCEEATVGFIGLGVMGLPMASNLLDAGVDLIVHNRSQGSVRELESRGARSAATPARVAAESAITITMLPDSPDVREVVCGPDGILAGARADDLVVDMSTIAPAVAVELCERASARDVGFVDAPVSGGDVGARDGTLSVMVGGEAAALERARPLLEILGSKVVHAGPSGSGQVVKAANQIVVAASLAGLAEALVLASRAGVEPAVVIDALSGGLAASRVLDVKGPKLLARDFAPGFAAELHLKDLRIAIETARKHGAPTPVVEAVTALMADLVEAGHGAEDHSSVLLELERRAATDAE